MALISLSKYRDGWNRIFGSITDVSKSATGASYNGSIDTRLFLRSKAASKLPAKIKTHRYFVRNSKIIKIFPQIGLPNDYMRNVYRDPEYGKLDLVFSSSGVRGLWDLATMSMRGVLSCMHWLNVHSIHLIGTIVDPFCAMIYLTDNKKTEYGRSIIKRSLVRLGYHYTTFKPTLFVERPYTKSHNTDYNTYVNKCTETQREELLKLFRTYISAKTKIPIAQRSGEIVIPHHKSLNDLFSNEHSMSDGCITYGKGPAIYNNYDEYNPYIYKYEDGVFADKFLTELRYPNITISN